MNNTNIAEKDGVGVSSITFFCFSHRAISSSIVVNQQTAISIIDAESELVF
jgi:hypothetical protein